MITIYYTKKITGAGTTYMNIDKEQQDTIVSKLISLQSFMNELSLSKNQDIKAVCKWYNTPSKTLPYNRNFERYNSPCSFIAGMVNNLAFGSQRDMSVTQAEHCQNILNNFNSLADLIKEMGHNLQINQSFENILFAEQLFDF
jgi:hypothetical protein